MTRRLEGQWCRRDEAAEARDLAEAGNLARLHRRKMAKAEREAKAMDAQTRAVGNAVRRAAREQQARHVEWLTVSPARKSGHNGGKRCLPRFEAMTGAVTLASHVGDDGLSSCHFSWRSRGLRPRKGQKNNHAYRRGEIVRLVKYILRDGAREIEGGGIVSSISTDPDEIASVLNAVEELEMAAGQQNANVYISIVISLPHELDAAGRERVLSMVAEAFREEELPFAGVLHKPDPGTDQRNFHAHLVTSLRPFRKEADGTYSFAAAASSELNDGEWIQPLRKRIVDAINEEMAQLEFETGIPQRLFTHLSHADRGLPPKSKAEGKRGPGRSAEARRAAEVEAAQAEIGFRRDQLKVLDELAGLVTSLAAHVPLDVTAILRVARERVAKQTETMRVAARAKRIKARLVAMTRPTHLDFIIGSSPLGLAAPYGRERPRGSNIITTLGSAPSLAKVPALSAVPSLHGTGAIPGGISQVIRSSRSAPSAGAVLPPASAGIRRQANFAGSCATNPPITSTPSTWLVGSSSKRSRSPDIQRWADLANALAAATALPFLPLRPDKRGAEPIRYLIDKTHAVASDLTDLRLIYDHQQHPRMQQLLKAKFKAMRRAVYQQLIAPPIRPKGKVPDLFDHDPRLAAAVRTAWPHRSLTRVVELARAVWVAREKAAASALEELRRQQTTRKGGSGR